MEQALGAWSVSLPKAPFTTASPLWSLLPASSFLPRGDHSKGSTLMTRSWRGVDWEGREALFWPLASTPGKHGGGGGGGGRGLTCPIVILSLVPVWEVPGAHTPSSHTHIIPDVASSVVRGVLSECCRSLTGRCHLSLSVPVIGLSVHSFSIPPAPQP